MIRAISDRAPKHLRRRDHRIIIHFDYDCFYAAVFEAENPALRSLPLAVQQKQIIVTCNYLARQRGLHKLQLITEAKRLCPDAIIVLGEDLTRFRNASKLLYNFLRAFSWNDKVERLGFDEVWMDVTDMIDYNMGIINTNDLANSFFQLSKTDPTSGFLFDASQVAGHTYPATPGNDQDSGLQLRLLLGSHLAFHLRLQLEEHHGYTSTVGVSTTKLISKLVGNVNKPKGQTTLMPPYEAPENGTSNILTFLDDHDVGAIPWIGFKLSLKLREFILNRPAKVEGGLIYGHKPERVTVKQVRDANVHPEVLERVLGGPGSPQGIGAKVHGLLHGIDDSEVSEARNVPRQISVEDSYIRLDTMDQVVKELKLLSTHLIERMRTDLTEIPDNDNVKLERQQQQQLQQKSPQSVQLRWMAHPSSLRLSTRPRSSLQPDGTRVRSFKRISRSAPVPSFIFNLLEPVERLADRLIGDSLIPLFKKLHPERSGWNLSLVNVAVTGMDDRGKRARIGDIGAIFKRMDDANEVHLDEWIDDSDNVAASEEADSDEDLKMDMNSGMNGNVGVTGHSTEEAQPEASDGTEWDMDYEEDDVSDTGFVCPVCGNTVLTFARVPHERFHELGE